MYTKYYKYSYTYLDLEIRFVQHAVSLILTSSSCYIQYIIVWMYFLSL